LLNDIRHNPLLWLLVFVPAVFACHKLTPDAQINIDYSVIAASGFLAALPAVLLVLGFQRYLVQGLTAGSVKG
jgi:ABC-type glycerol-3-phosphate transport system permease component